MVIRVSTQFLQNAEKSFSIIRSDNKEMLQTVHAFREYDLAHALLACTALHNFLLKCRLSCLLIGGNRSTHPKSFDLLAQCFLSSTCRGSISSYLLRLLFYFPLYLRHLFLSGSGAILKFTLCLIALASIISSLRGMWNTNRTHTDRSTYLGNALLVSFRCHR